MKLLNKLSISILSGYFTFNSFAENKLFPVNSMDTIKSPIEYINSNFENASRLFWEFNPDGSVLINMLYDHERNSPNRASNHWYFQVQAKAGSDVTIYIQYFDEIYNGKKVESYSLVKSFYISEDGKNWRTIPAENTGNKSHKLQIHMNSNSIYIAGVEPYRLSDLEKFLTEIKGNPLIEITQIGRTVEGKTLEIIRVGNPDAPYRVFLRARAHPWEPGGNWVVQGLIKSLLEKDAAHYLKKYCVYVLPMANKYLVNMEKLESLMKKYTWFTEGSTGKDFRTQGSFGEGLVERYGIDACILELNQTWIKGLNKQPFGKDWELLGKQMRDVFFYYFDGMK